VADSWASDLAATPRQRCCSTCQFEECSNVRLDRQTTCAFYEPNKWEGPDQ
jgi:hypothetical protein